MKRGGFSWKRFLGISRMKSDISRKIGIPLTRSGRERKVGRMVTKGCFDSCVLLMVPVLLAWVILRVFA